MEQKKNINEKCKCEKEEVVEMLNEFLGRFSDTKKHLLGVEKEMLLAAKSLLEVGIDLLDHKRSHIDNKKKASKSKIEKVEIS